MKIDIVNPKPRTQYEYWIVRMNNMQAQWVGLSSFSKTIEVKYER